jgi:hypothetical protein
MNASNVRQSLRNPHVSEWRAVRTNAPFGELHGEPLPVSVRRLLNASGAACLPEPRPEIFFHHRPPAFAEMNVISPAGPASGVAAGLG